jgi:hypothetical protein
MIVAFILFLALVVAWVVLPGTVMAAGVQESTEPLSVSVPQTA